MSGEDEGGGSKEVVRVGKTKEVAVGKKIEDGRLDLLEGEIESMIILFSGFHISCMK